MSIDRDLLAAAVEPLPLAYMSPGAVAAVLLPVVDRIANERAAAELEAAADAIPYSDSELEAKQILRARAAALREPTS